MCKPGPIVPALPSRFCGSFRAARELVCVGLVMMHKHVSPSWFLVTGIWWFLFLPVLRQEKLKSLPMYLFQVTQESCVIAGVTLGSRPPWSLLKPKVSWEPSLRGLTWHLTNQGPSCVSEEPGAHHFRDRRVIASRLTSWLKVGMKCHVEELGHLLKRNSHLLHESESPTWRWEDANPRIENASVGLKCHFSSPWKVLTTTYN